MTADIQKLPRKFLPEDFTVTTWDKLEPYFKELLERPITSNSDLEKWLRDISELEAVVSEDACWRQINMTCDTENKALEEAFNFFCLQRRIIQQVSEKIAKISGKGVRTEIDFAKLEESFLGKRTGNTQ